MANTVAEDEKHRLTAIQGLAALSLDALSSVASGPEAILVVLVAAEESFRERWEQWRPNVPLVTLRTAHRSIAKPIVKYLCDIEAKDHYHKIVVLVPEVQPPKFWDYLLFNQRGAILDRAIRRATANVVLCRLRYRLEQFAPHDSGNDSAGAPAAPASAPPPG